jgi:cholesterol oxidase
MQESTAKPDILDYLVIGSGFGGSVSAMRLSEKGYSVLVIEKGKRWTGKDFPKSNWNVRKYLWMPLIKCFGFQKLTFFKEVFVLSGVGVGGGSLVYANTHMMPKENFYTNAVWSHLNRDWKDALAPFFEKAKFMLGSEKFSKEYEEDRILKEVATEMGHGDTYGRVDYVGVYLGDTKKSVDPYFKGLGPLRTGCTECAGCMVGCRFNAKNTLDKNYLWFAENIFGARVVAETRVTKIEYLNNLYHIHAEQSTRWWGKKRQTFISRGLIMSGGVLGTMDLLLKQKHIYKTLPHLSEKLGDNILTNSEMLSGVVAADRKLNHGVAISSVFHADENTHIELCKFPDGSGAMMRLATMAAGNGKPIVRIAKMFGNVVTQPWNFLRSLFNFKLAETSIIFLIMQTLPNAMQMKLKRGVFGTKLIMKNEGGQKVPSFIPVGQDALYRYAKKVNGVPHNAITEIAFGLSSTAHILGGCPMGKTTQEGVVDENFKVHGYDNFYILDGSIIPCNLGVNPSLTITTLSEYAMSLIPAKEGSKQLSLEKRMQAIQNN